MMPDHDRRGQPMTSKNTTTTSREFDQDPRGSTEWQEDWGEGDEWLEGRDDSPGYVYVMARASIGGKMSKRKLPMDRGQKGGRRNRPDQYQLGIGVEGEPSPSASRPRARRGSANHWARYCSHPGRRTKKRIHHFRDADDDRRHYGHGR